MIDLDQRYVKFIKSRALTEKSLISFQNYILAVEAMKERTYYREEKPEARRQTGVPQHLGRQITCRTDGRMIEQMPVTAASSEGWSGTRSDQKRGQNWQLVDNMGQEVNHDRVQEIRTQMAVLQRELDRMSGPRQNEDSNSQP